MALYAFDGTWNSEHKDQAEYGLNTNVVKFARLYNGPRTMMQKQGDQTTVANDPDDFVVSGVGTRHGRFGKFFGGAFGVGGRARINEARKEIDRNFKDGDRDVDVIGFSRGAALALQFANVLQKDGIALRFLGLWDVVAAFGIPINLGPLQFQRINLGYKLTLPDNVQYCFHAVSMDERRQAFRVTRVDNGYQVWFRGVHSDVGGGNANEGLSNISLRWMLRKAIRIGLPITPAADNVAVNVGAAVSKNKDLIKNKFRELQKNDRFHYTVSPSKLEDCQNSPAGCPVETEADESNNVPTVKELQKR